MKYLNAKRLVLATTLILLLGNIQAQICDPLSAYLSSADPGGTAIFTNDPSGLNTGVINYTQDICIKNCGVYEFDYTVEGSCINCPEKTSHHIIRYWPCDSLSIQIDEFSIGYCLYNIFVNVQGCHEYFDVDWNTGEDSQQFVGGAGLYSVTVTSQLNPDCMDVADRALTCCELICEVFTLSDCNINNPIGEATVEVDLGAEPYTYLWSNDETTQTITGLEAGTYTVTVTDEYGCTSVCFGEVDSESEARELECFYKTKDVGIWSDWVYFDCDYMVCSSSFDSIIIEIRTEPSYDGVLLDILSTGPNSYTGTGLVSLDNSLVNSGTYNFVYTDPLNGCTSIKDFELTIYDDVPPTCVKTEDCDQDGEITVLETYDSYLWSNDETTQTITGLSTGTYTVTVTDEDGCTGTCSETINYDSGSSYCVFQPHYQIRILDGSFGSKIYGSNYQETMDINYCNDGGTDLKLFATCGITTDHTYLWSTGDTSFSITENNITVDTTYSVTVTNVSTGCVHYITYNANPIDDPQPTCQKSESCGDNGEITVLETYDSYLWSNDETTQTIDELSAGTYTVTVTDSNGCTGTCSKTINVDETDEGTPLVCRYRLKVNSVWEDWNELSCNYEGCVNDFEEIEFQAESDPSTGIADFVDVIGPNSYSNTGTVILDNDESNEGVYDFSYEDGFGCITTTSFTLIIHPIPVITLLTTNETCDESNASIKVLETFSSYLWSNTETTQEITDLTAGTYIVTVTDIEGCTSTAEQDVTDSSYSLGVDIAGDLEICGEFTTLTATTTATVLPIEYEWSTAETTISIDVSTAETYTVTVTDGNGCTGTSSVIVVAEPSLVSFIDSDVTYEFDCNEITINLPEVICDCCEADITANLSVSIKIPGGSFYSIFFGLVNLECGDNSYIANNEFSDLCLAYPDETLEIAFNLTSPASDCDVSGLSLSTTDFEVFDEDFYDTNDCCCVPEYELVEGEISLSLNCFSTSLNFIQPNEISCNPCCDGVGIQVAHNIKIYVDDVISFSLPVLPFYGCGEFSQPTSFSFDLCSLVAGQVIRADYTSVVANTSECSGEIGQSIITVSREVLQSDLDACGCCSQFFETPILDTLTITDNCEIKAVSSFDGIQCLGACCSGIIGTYDLRQEWFLNDVSIAENLQNNIDLICNNTTSLQYTLPGYDYCDFDIDDVISFEIEFSNVDIFDSECFSSNVLDIELIEDITINVSQFEDDCECCYEPIFTTSLPCVSSTNGILMCDGSGYDISFSIDTGCDCCCSSNGSGFCDDPDNLANPITINSTQDIASAVILNECTVGRYSLDVQTTSFDIIIDCSVNLTCSSWPCSSPTLNDGTWVEIEVTDVCGDIYTLYILETFC